MVLKAFDSSELSAISRLFSASVIQEIARKGSSPLFARLVKESSLLDSIKLTDPIKTLFKNAFSILRKKDNRHEYIYKAAIMHKVLLGVHSLQTASMLSEFRVDKCRADTVILNGTSTVYEIKSERDNLEKLEKQIAAYRNIFASVNVITGENHLDAVAKIVPDDVGILLLTDRHQIREIKESKDLPCRTKPEVIFDSIQLNEAKKILDLMGIETPAFPNTQAYQVLRNFFITMDPENTHSAMVKVLKNTRSLLPLDNFIQKLPSSLQAAAITTPLRKQDRERLINVLDTPVYDAITNWN